MEHLWQNRIHGRMFSHCILQGARLVDIANNLVEVAAGKHSEKVKIL